ncbi:MAG: MerR family DNA-binding protein [Elusimicrobia bacterium]|nr:MerR family DNA-binding protein [Elusimicrobiota bacterium]
MNIQTVRYYERRNLLVPDGRRDSGYRLYSDAASTKLRFIKNAQELGFTLDEILGLLKLQVRHRSQCAEVKRRAQEKLADVETKIAALKNLEKTLKGLIKTCRARTPTDPCPILRTLELDDRDAVLRPRSRL